MTPAEGAAHGVDEGDRFLLQAARTRRFTLGVPRGFTLSDDGGRVAFLRARAGDDPVTDLWLLDLARGGDERLVAEAPGLTSTADDSIPAVERARRERAREAATGIVRFSADRALKRVAFDVAGAIHAVDLDTGATNRLAVDEPAVDARIDPTGARVAYVSAGALHVIDAQGGNDHTILSPEGAGITYGLAEFIAAEEMGRQEGFWWSPDGTRMLVARVDVSPVQRWYISDPADPARPPREVAYPVAGSRNATVALLVAGVTGLTVPVRWDSEGFEYLVAAHWDDHALLIVVQSRDQRTMRVLAVAPESGETRLVREDADSCWVDIVHGVPRHLADGSLVWTADSDDAKRLVIADHAVTPSGLQVRSVLDVDGDTVLFSASSEPTSAEVWTWSPAAGAVRLAPDSGPGVCTARRSGATTVIVRRSLETPGVSVVVHREGGTTTPIRSRAEAPVVTPRVEMLRLGARELRAALLWPADHTPGSGSLPVLLDPYGGPATQRVVAAQGAFAESQWFADQGFAVLVIDGRGTPGRGPSWARSIRGNRVDPVLEDQIEGLRAAAETHPELDLSRVGIRGWSYGGYLAALAVLTRPDVFHAAVAGAPDADARLYDTHYTERYLGMPDEEPENYDRSSLPLLAPRLERPLLLIHGLSDDNVVVAHTLRLSAALVAAGRPHQLVLLPGVTHVTNRPDSTSVQRLQLEFLQRSLSASSPRRSPVDAPTRHH
ncbi:MAG TPA: prolyl oligopeptidase family serine peptidase [Candidatus Dormibacteraeota bacterium]